MLHKAIQNRWCRLALAVAATLLYAIGVNWFIVPMGLYTGGLLGFCQVARTLIVEALGLSPNVDFSGILYLAANVPILLLAWQALGRGFLVRTAVCTVTSSLFLSLVPPPAAPLVEEMLTLFRAESVRRETAFSEVDLSDVVTDAALRFEPVMFESGRRLLYTIDEGLQVSGDRDALERLTGILLDNAVKYAPQGTDIRLTLTRQDRTACLAVENGGDPIPPEVAAHLFDRFYRADSSRTGTGFGLGLAIARAIVQNHRGNIICRSQEGLNRFSVTLPILRQKGAQ